MQHRLAAGDEVEAIRGLLDGHGWTDDPIENGDLWGSFDGGEAVGTLRLVDAGPSATYVASVLVREDRRGAGIGSDLMRAAMATRSGRRFFLVCHPERLGFYGRLGFSGSDRGIWPAEIVVVARAEDDWDSDHDELHHFLSTPEPAPA